jgi:hypothetical protein
VPCVRINVEYKATRSVGIGGYSLIVIRFNDKHRLVCNVFPARPCVKVDKMVPLSYWCSVW